MKNKIIEEIINVVKKEFDVDLKSVAIQIPKDKSNGDFATTVAMALKGQLNKNPQEIAKTIKENFNLDGVEKIEIAGPGFINIFVQEGNLFSVINDILKTKDNFGKGKDKNNNPIMVEYISANPTGWLHIGHARNAAYGASLVSALKFAGYNVSSEYYINDAGTQMNLLGESTLARYKELFGNKVEIKEEYYKGADIIECAKALKDEVGDKYLNNKEDDIEEIREYAYKHMLATLKTHLKEFNVEIDNWYSERSIYTNDLFKPSLKALKDNGYIYEKDGATWCATTKIRDDKDRVVIKADGEKTYFASDIAYHWDKLERGFNPLINVWGADHHGYIDRVRAALIALGSKEDALEVELMQMVKVLRDGKEVKMSKRMGTAITIKELIDEIGADALRYFLVSRTQNSQMTIDIDVAKKTSNENPLFYVQYAHARCHQLLEKISIDKNVNLDLLSSDSEGAVAKELVKFGDVVEATAKHREPHRITNYAYELASAFHKYYGSAQIVDEKNIELTSARLTMIKAVKQVLANALKLIGVNAPDKM